MQENKPKPVQPPPGSNPVLKPPPVRRPILLTTTIKKQKSKPKRKCCCVASLILVILVVLCSVTGCVAYLLLEPRVPVFHLRSIRFVRFNVSDGYDGSVLETEVAVRVEVRNRNRVLGVDYGRTRVVMRGDDDVEFGSGGLVPFRQPKTNTTVFKLTTKVKGMLLESGLGKKVRNGYRSKRLKMGSEINTGVGFYTKGWNTFKLPIKAICEGVSIKDLETGSSVPKCKITIFKILNINS